MTTNYKVLGQVGNASTETTLYTVPANTQTVCSTICVCNRSAVGATFSIRINVGGEANNDMQMVCSNVAMDGSDTLFLTFGATLDSTDVVKVTSSTSTVTFQLFGSEIS
jgi:hypothetical protein